MNEYAKERISIRTDNTLISADPGDAGARNNPICAPRLAIAEESPPLQIGGAARVPVTPNPTERDAVHVHGTVHGRGCGQARCRGARPPGQASTFQARRHSVARAALQRGLCTRCAQCQMRTEPVLARIGAPHSAQDARRGSPSRTRTGCPLSSSACSGIASDVPGGSGISLPPLACQRRNLPASE
jgi:hypothetical protein